MKSNVKPNSFYKEAESMQTGWGKYLLSIDKLKNKVQYNKPISLNETCWILYGEGYCSDISNAFHQFCTKQKIHKKTMPWLCWLGILKISQSKNETLL